MKFKSLLIAAMAVMTLASCSKNGNEDGPSVPEGDKNVVVKMNFEPGKTKAADDQTAVGESPNFTRLALIFTNATDVLKVSEVDLTGTDKDKLESANGMEFTVPTAVTKLYAIGNYGASPGLGSPTLPVAGSSVADLQALAMDLSAQTSFQAVNLSAGQGASGAKFEGVGFTTVGTTDTYTLDIVPAFARYEIKKVSINPNADQKLESFKLTGIFITNTYKNIGLDYSTVTNAIKYGPGTSGFDGQVPSYLKDILTPSAVGTSFSPNTFDNSIDATDGFWPYMVASPIAGKGTTLDGNTAAELSVPVIVLKIEGAVGAAGNDLNYDPVSYVSVRKLIPTTGANTTDPLEYLRPGFVYTIDDIAFGGEHLSSTPGDNTTESVAVKVTFKEWQGQPVRPAL